jgi:Zn-dependent protease
MQIGQIAIWFVVFLLSLTVHECAHAWMAEKVGDSTGRYLGRITLNPIPHIDVFGTIILPLIAITSGGLMFGWAKPVPYNPANLRDRKRGELLIAAAGPLSNVLLVILFFILAKVLFRTPLVNSLGDLGDPLSAFMEIGIKLNIILAVFNMIPVPPLDGSKVLMNLLPDSLAQEYAKIPEWAGMAVLLLLIFTGFTSTLIFPIERLVWTLFNL